MRESPPSDRESGAGFRCMGLFRLSGGMSDGQTKNLSMKMAERMYIPAVSLLVCLQHRFIST